MEAKEYIDRLNQIDGYLSSDEQDDESVSKTVAYSEYNRLFNEFKQTYPEVFRSWIVTVDK